MDRSLWEFSLAIYAAPGVAARCLELQENRGADVNLILCAAWIGASGRGQMDGQLLAALDAAVRPLRENVIQPLRAARIWLRVASAASPELASLRTELKRLELAAEHAEQTQLERLVDARPAMADPVRRRAAAVSNMAIYLAQLGSPAVAEDDPLAQALSVFLETNPTDKNLS